MYYKIFFVIFEPFIIAMERCRSGLSGTPGKRVYFKRVPGVRIPLFPLQILDNKVFN